MDILPMGFVDPSLVEVSMKKQNIAKDMKKFLKDADEYPLELRIAAAFIRTRPTGEDMMATEAAWQKMTDKFIWVSHPVINNVQNRIRDIFIYPLDVTKIPLP